MSRVSRSLKRLVVVGASTAVVATGTLPLTMGIANAAAGDDATAVTLTPATTSDTVGNCTPYTATVTPTNGTFDVQISENASQSGTSIGFCDVSGYNTGATPAYPNPQNPQPVASNTDTTVNGAGPYTCDAQSTAVTTVKASCDAQFTATNGKVSFGVTSDTPGQMQILAYNDNDANNKFNAGDQSLDSSAETWVANQAAGNVTCQPTSQTANTGSTVHFDCTATTSAGTSVNGSDGVLLRDEVTAGPDAGFTFDCTYNAGTTVNSNGGQNGSWDCPVTNGGQEGTDTIRVYADNNGNGSFDNEPQTQVSASFVKASPTGTTVSIVCEENQADDTGEWCEDPTSDGTETFTATVHNSAGGPVSGVPVDFNTQDGTGGDADISPSSCVSGSDGSCSTTLTNSDPQDGDWFEVQAEITTQSGTVTSDWAEKDWHNPTPDEARNVTVTPADADQVPGGVQELVATVVDRFDNPVQNACVGWTESGPGRFFGGNDSNDVTNTSHPHPAYCVPSPDGSDPNAGPNQTSTTTYDFVCLTNAAGQCKASLSTQSGESGDETVTVDIGNYTNERYFFNTTSGNDEALQECSLPADTTYGDGTDNGDAYDNGWGTYEGSYASVAAAQDSTNGATYAPPGVIAGSCTDQSTITWGTPPGPSKTVMHLTLTCKSHHKHKIKCVAQTIPARSGLTVKLFNAKNGHKVGQLITNSVGKAVFHINHKKSGKTYKYQAHLNATKTTTGADSNVAKVTVK